MALHLVDLGGQPVDTGSAVGRFFFLMLVGVAEMERNLIRERTKAALAHEAARGRRVGTVPLGFKVGPDGLLVVDEDERLAVEGMLALRATSLFLLGAHPDVSMICDHGDIGMCFSGG